MEKETKRVLVFDTETTGLPSKKKPLDEQPHVVQFAGIVVDMNVSTGEWKEVARIDQLVKPPIPIPYITSEVHGIFDIDVKEKEDFASYAKTISYFLNEPDFIVAHNLKFDETIIRYEYDRLKAIGHPCDFLPKNTICTMEASRYYCDLPGKSKFAKKPKAPKLQELTQKTLGTKFDGAHNAIVDVEWTLKAFSKLVEKGVVKLEEEKSNEITLF